MMSSEGPLFSFASGPPTLNPPLTLCLVFNSYKVSCSLTCPQFKACWKVENSHRRLQTFFRVRGQLQHIAYLFLVTDVAMLIDVHKTFYCFYTTKYKVNARMKARAPIASILKSFSGWAACEFATKLYFLSSVAAFAELVHKSRYHCKLHHGRRKGEPSPPGFWKFQQKRLFS